MKPVLLIDFGSTYTKLTAVDLDGEAVIGTAASYTTVQTDINEGLEKALNQLRRDTGDLDFSRRFACSSAAGGLRMVTGGLVPDLTAKAAKLASLGAGAKVIKVFSYQLTDEDIEEIDSLRPDIFLLTGGTDGGNTSCILHNAEMLAGCKTQFPIVVAGNRVCAKKCVELLAGKEVFRCANVLPTLGTLNIEPAQDLIREVFLRRIVHAKGLDKAVGLVSGILMPTPGAMLQAMKLLAMGTEREAGIGDLLGVDLGGATTDIYSMAAGNPEQMNTVIKGLPEPYAKRTVEGDVGMRYSIHGIVEAAGLDAVSGLSGLAPQRVAELVKELSEMTDRLPDTPELAALDSALAAMAVEVAVARHAGTVEQVFTPMGVAYMQLGKDLRSVSKIVATGGALIHAPNPEEILKHALYSEKDAMSLRPRAAEILVDRNYILAAMGLLSEEYPETALRIMKKELLG